MDRNVAAHVAVVPVEQSLSARRAWIEIRLMKERTINWHVALRKESVDRNTGDSVLRIFTKSLSARRAWIEIPAETDKYCRYSVALRKESVDRNSCWLLA